MNTELTTTAGPLLLGLLLAGTAGSAEQVITPAPLQRTAVADQPVAFTVGYTTANPCADLTGLGLRIHWNSRLLAFEGLTGVYPAALVATGPVESDTADADADPLTDRFVQVAWAAPNGPWPGGGCASRALYSASFRALAGFVGATSIRFSASSTAAGYTLSALAAVVNLVELDTDADGVPDRIDLDDDNDGIPDTRDNCPLAPNRNQADDDSDRIGDVCDSARFCRACLPSRGGWRAILR